MTKAKRTRSTRVRAARVRVVAVGLVACAALSVVATLVWGPSWWAAIAWPLVAVAVFLPVALKPVVGKTSAPWHSDDDSEHEEKMAELTEGLATLGQAMERVDEAAQGYRRKLEADGYSPSVAEQLAAKYHASIIDRLGG